MFLVSLSLLVIPMIGYQYVQKMHQHLRQDQETALLERARMVAALLHERPALFSVSDSSGNRETRSHLYVRPLTSPIQLDGYGDDWRDYDDRTRDLSVDNAVAGAAPYDAASLTVSYRLGSDDRYLYGLFEIHDDKVVYQPPATTADFGGDRLEIVLPDARGTVRRYMLTTSAPGWINPRPLDASDATPAPLQAEWQETAVGYNIEIRIPLNEVHGKLGFAILDVDSTAERTVGIKLATVNKQRRLALGTIVVPIPELQALLTKLDYPALRTWVIDKDYRVLALSGQLTEIDEVTLASRASESDAKKLTVLEVISRIFYRLVLPQPVSEFRDDMSAASRLEGEEVIAALAGTPAVHWRQSEDGRVTILTATHPVTADGSVVGAVAIEQTSNAILLMQNRAMELLIKVSAWAFFVATVTLLIFASRLSWRIRRLRNQTEGAIGHDGRVQNRLTPSRSRDEIGDLSRSFAGMLDRLSEYNRYLETMAGKLSHEIRTPVTVLRSSLDNLDGRIHADNAQPYLIRAREGLARLDGILTRMSEATRLEQTLQHEQTERFDLDSVVEGCVAGYRLAYSNHPIELSITGHEAKSHITVNGAPELIAQMLDKLVANAVDFATAGSTVEVSIRNNSDNVNIDVKNQGPLLPDAMRGNLFESMISLRDAPGSEPHLGLGLYIARLIVQFHNGTILAANSPDGDGVIFTVTLPRP